MKLFLLPFFFPFPSSTVCLGCLLAFIICARRFLFYIFWSKWLAYGFQLNWCTINKWNWNVSEADRQVVLLKRVCSYSWISKEKKKIKRRRTRVWWRRAYYSFQFEITAISFDDYNHLLHSFRLKCACDFLNRFICNSFDSAAHTHQQRTSPFRA